MRVLAIAGRELRSLFVSPLAWTVLAVVQLIAAYLFLVQIEAFLMLQPRLLGMEGAPGVTDVVVAPLFGNAAVILLLVVPLLTMRLVSEEHRNRTLSLLLSAPVSMTEIVLGKYLGLLAFLLAMLALLALMPLSLLVGGGLDLGKLGAGLMGLALLVASFAAAGLFMSTLTAQPTVAAVSTFGLLLLLWIIDWAGNAGSQASQLFAYLSLLRHYESLLLGMFNSADVVYYLLFTLTFLVLSVRRLDAQRLQH
jgi:ABC-2 type transport system permease protein